MRKAVRIKVYVKGGGFLLPFGSHNIVAIEIVLDSLNLFSHNIEWLVMLVSHNNVWPVNINNKIAIVPFCKSDNSEPAS